MNRWPSRKDSREEEGSLRLYFEDLSDSTPLTREREVELSERIKAGDLQARNELVQANLRFVIHVAKQYQNRGLGLSDLISAGNLGLMKAAERFDGERGFKFISYAVWWIRQSILQTIADHGRTVRLPLNKLGTVQEHRQSVHAARRGPRFRAAHRGDRPRARAAGGRGARRDHERPQRALAGRELRRGTGSAAS